MKMITFLIFALSTQVLRASECSKLMENFLQKSSSEKPTQTEINVSRYGFQNTSDGKRQFENLYAQCMSPDKNSFKEVASNKVNRIFQVMTAATTVIGYTESNWSKQKNTEWFERLGYNLVFGAVCGSIYGKLINDDSNRFKFIITDYIFNRFAAVGWSIGNNLIFSEDKGLKNKIAQLKNSPHFASDIQSLKQFSNRENIFEKWRDDIQKYLKENDHIDLGLGVHQGVNFDKLTPNDLNDPDIQKVVIAAIMAQEYERTKRILELGDVYTDYFAYDSLYSILKIPKDLYISKITNQIMCLNSNNPTRGLVQVIGINTLNQILFADYYGIVYEVGRKELTGEK